MIYNTRGVKSTPILFRPTPIFLNPHPYFACFVVPRHVSEMKEARTFPRRTSYRRGSERTIFASQDPRA